MLPFFWWTFFAPQKLLEKNGLRIQLLSIYLKDVL